MLRNLYPCQLAVIDSAEYSRDNAMGLYNVTVKCKVIDKYVRTVFSPSLDQRREQEEKNRSNEAALTRMCCGCEYRKELESIREDIEKRGK